jgi:glycosyltransferase involved in cell wall biosynthesis
VTASPALIPATAPPVSPRVAEAVRSLLAQEPCELVVVNDGSTDPHTLRVLHELEAAGCHVLHQRNRGTSAARMAGVWATRAPYVFPLDADDAVMPGSLTALVETLEARPGMAAARGRVRLFGDEERGRASALDPWRITYLNNIPYPGLIRREALLRVGGWSLPGPFQDWDLWMALAEAGYRGAGIDEPVLRYRLHGGRQFARGAARHAELYSSLQSRPAGCSIPGGATGAARPTRGAFAGSSR